MKKGLLVFFALLVLIPALMFAGGDKESGAGDDDTFKVAYIFLSLPGDLGWTFEHEAGRKMVEAKFGDKVSTTYIENVPEGPDAARIIRQYAQQGYDMICLLYTSPSPRDVEESRMPSSA